MTDGRFEPRAFHRDDTDDDHCGLTTTTDAKTTASIGAVETDPAAGR